tara:strand:- start:38 stop:667 length:630 start_codon:yes stop_codon:yes gene_type:complete
MRRKISDVDDYLTSGCGRCELFETPECKVHRWQEELRVLRRIVQESGLTEDVKWSQPCYTLGGKNVVLVTAFKESAVLSFCKGALLSDPKQLLELPGKNSHAGRVIRFKSAKQIRELEPALKKLLVAAIEAEEAGRKVPARTGELEAPEELKQILAEDPDLKAAFAALTPGRQRGYLLHFTGAKQSKTRTSRIMKCKEKILAGKGLQDR